MTQTRYKIHNQSQPHFFTCTVTEWTPIFFIPTMAEIVIRSLNFLIEQKHISVFAYVLMENHFHCIAQAKCLGKEVANFKSYTAYRIIEHATELGRKDFLRIFRTNKPAWRKDRTHQVWISGSHPQEIISEAMLIQKIEYIHNNPVKRGYIDDPTCWRYSSARNYAGKRGPVSIVTDWHQ